PAARRCTRRPRAPPAGTAGRLPAMRERHRSRLGVARRRAGLIGSWRIVGFVDAKPPGLDRAEKLARLVGVFSRHENLNGAEAVEREAMRVPQRLAALDRRYAGGLEKRTDLLRLHLAAGDEHAGYLLIHTTPPNEPD